MRWDLPLDFEKKDGCKRFKSLFLRVAFFLNKYALKPTGIIEIGIYLLK